MPSPGKFIHLHSPRQRQVLRSQGKRFCALHFSPHLFALLMGLAPTMFGQAAPDQSPDTRAKKEFTNSLGMKLVGLPHSPVAISIWETRVTDWETYLKHEGTTWTHKPPFTQTQEDPAVNITLSEAVEFCNWLTNLERKSGKISERQSYRLPTKLEWDAAAGITADGNQSNASFPWGDTWPPMRQSGNYHTRRITGGRDDGFEFTAPVGQFFPSRSGCYDLGGNASEWTADADPEGNLTSALRGGSWMYWRRECLESQYLYAAPSTTRSPGIGFRVVLEDGAEAARLVRDRQNSAAKLMEKPAVDQKEVDEMKRKLVERRRQQEERSSATPPSSSSAQEAPAPK